MRRLAKIGIVAALLTAALYGVLWDVSGLWDVGGDAADLDSVRGEADLYRTSLREFVYRLPAFCRTARSKANLFIVGGSTAKAFRPPIIGPRLPGWQVNDVALSFGNVTQMAQGVALIRSCLGEEAFRRARFALCAEYIELSPNARRWPTPYTMLELDELRHGLFEGPPGAVRPVLSWRALPLAILAMRPILTGYGFFEQGWDASTGGANMVGGTLVAQTREAVRDREFEGLAALMGPPDEAVLHEQEAEMDRLVQLIRAAGSEAFIIDMPVEDWITRRTPQQPLYHAWIADFVSREGVPDIDLTAIGADGDFVDGLHATPQGARRWSEAAAVRLHEILAQEAHSAAAPAPSEAGHLAGAVEHAAKPHPVNAE